MANNYANIIQGIIKSYNNGINVEVGSPLYYMVVLPSGEVYKRISENINTLALDSSILTASDKDPLLSNFGIPRKTGVYGTGYIKVKMKSGLSVYSFPEGAQFTHTTKVGVVATQDTIIRPSSSLEAIIPVRTSVATNEVYDIGEIFTPLLYGGLVDECKVTTQISGGYADETDEELLARIEATLAQTSTTKTGIENIIKNNFPSVIDVKVFTENVFPRDDLGRDLGIKIDAYVKVPFTEKTVTVASGEKIKDIVVEVVEASSPILSSSKQYGGTKYEENLYTFSTPDITITYISPTNINEIQDYIDNEDVFPIGTDILVKLADPVKVTGSVYLYKDVEEELSNIYNYIYNHIIGDFYIYDMIETANITKFKMPINIKFTNLYTGQEVISQNDYIYDKAGYYMGDFTVWQL